MSTPTGYGERPGAGQTHTRRLSPEQVRMATFGRRALGRKGLHEDDVYDFLHRVALELDGLETELATTQAETAGSRRPFGDWQSRRGNPRSIVAAWRRWPSRRQRPVPASGRIEVPVAETDATAASASRRRYSAMTVRPAGTPRRQEVRARRADLPGHRRPAL